MAEAIGPKGKQIPDGSLEIADLPAAPANNQLILAGTSGAAYVTLDTFIPLITDDGGNGVTKVWSAQYLTTVVGDIEAALDAILGV